MGARLALPTLLSQALVAFTIEFDNSFEARFAHHTTDFGGPRRTPWAISLMLWANCLRAVDADGIDAGELEGRTLARPHLSGLSRWGYVTVSGGRVTPTAAGRRAQAVWAPLVAEIEARWVERFGAGPVGELRAELERANRERGLALSQYLTFVYGGRAAPAAPDRAPLVAGPLYAELSRALHAFALAYEQDAEVPLQMCANVLRLLDGDGQPVAELPARSGVAAVSIQIALRLLAKRGVVTVSSGRGRRARLTEAGVRALARYRRRVPELEADRFTGLRERLEPLVAGDPSPLWAGLAPPPGSWRARSPRPTVLAHHPVLRQGGHPDGS